ncbi:MAG: SpoIIIAH-like family protein [Lachnospira sp.]
MKKIKKNQIIITALAIMIAVTGYLNYTSGLKLKETQNDTENAAMADSDAVNTDEGLSEELSTDENGNIQEPGAVILTSGNVSADMIAQAKLSREQVRAGLFEELMEIVDNESLDNAAKTNAVNQIAEITDAQNKETAIELLLEAKGFTNSVVSIVDGECDVVLNAVSITDSQRAQVEDIVKRKSGLSADKITINICNN